MITRDHLKTIARVQPAATESQLDGLSRALGMALPPRYMDLLRASNGFSIEGKESDVYIYACNLVPERNVTYETQSYLGRVLRIGDDGGGIGFHIRLNDDAPVIAVGDGCPSLEDGRQVAESLQKWADDRFSFDYGESSDEYRFVRVSLAAPVSVSDLATLKKCLKLTHNIIHLKKRSETLPVTLLNSIRLDVVKNSLENHPELGESLVATDTENPGITYSLIR